MKIDLVGPKRRGLRAGTERGGRLRRRRRRGGAERLAGSRVRRPRRSRRRRSPSSPSSACSISVLFVRDTAAHVALEQARDHADADSRPPRLRDAFPDATYREPALRACSQAGLVNNLNDALAWGLVPLFLAADGGERRRDRADRRALSGGLGRRSDLDRALVGHGRPQAADRRRDAGPGRGAGSARRLGRPRRRSPLVAPSRSASARRSSTRP